MPENLLDEQHKRQREQAVRDLRNFDVSFPPSARTWIADLIEQQAAEIERERAAGAAACAEIMRVAMGMRQQAGMIGPHDPSCTCWFCLFDRGIPNPGEALVERLERAEGLCQAVADAYRTGFDEPGNAGKFPETIWPVAARVAAAFPAVAPEPITKPKSCPHEYSADGGPCSRCGQSVAEMLDDAAREPVVDADAGTEPKHSRISSDLFNDDAEAGKEAGR